MSVTQGFIKAALVSIPLLSGTALQAQIDPHSQTNVTPTVRLGNYCGPENMKTRAGQNQCVQETAGQSNTFAESFHAALFTKAGLPADVRSYYAMVEKWDKIVTDDKDRNTLNTYATSCGSKIMELVANPDAALDFSYTTAFNLPKYCVDTARAFAKKYDVPVNHQEADRLSQHLGNIYSYYQKNPQVPPRLTPPAPAAEPTPEPKRQPGKRDWQFTA